MFEFFAALMMTHVGYRYWSAASSKTNVPATVGAEVVEDRLRSKPNADNTVANFGYVRDDYDRYATALSYMEPEQAPGIPWDDRPGMRPPKRIDHIQTGITAPIYNEFHQFGKNHNFYRGEQTNKVFTQPDYYNPYGISYD